MASRTGYFRSHNASGSLFLRSANSVGLLPFVIAQRGQLLAARRLRRVPHQIVARDDRAIDAYCPSIGFSANEELGYFSDGPCRPFSAGSYGQLPIHICRERHSIPIGSCFQPNRVVRHRDSCPEWYLPFPTRGQFAAWSPLRSLLPSVLQSQSDSAYSYEMALLVWIKESSGSDEPRLIK